VIGHLKETEEKKSTICIRDTDKMYDNKLGHGQKVEIFLLSSAHLKTKVKPCSYDLHLCLHLFTGFFFKNLDGMHLSVAVTSILLL
jgi:hypothetical protein